MNLDFFLKFNKFHIASLVAAEDFADRFNFQVTSALIVMFVVVVGVRQYIFSPIQCWIPKEFDKAWEEYTENYCWVADTYFAQVDGGPPPELGQREARRIGYYQWVPFVLGLQALLFYTPHLLWKLLSVRSGTNVRSVVRYAADANTFDQEKRSKMISFLARQLEKMIVAKRRHPSRIPGIDPAARNRRLTRFHSFCRSCWCCSVFSRQSGVALLATYFVIKCLYLGNAVGQLFMMRLFLGFNSTTFGADILLGLIDGRTWFHSGLFPRVTWCDFVVRRVGNPQRYSVQCVLPINMLNEKIYIFLWFWVTAAAFLMGLSLIRWAVTMLGFRYRRRFVKHYLRLLGPVSRFRSHEQDDPKLLHKFVSQFLRHDGVLMLRMIGHNAGDLIVAELLAEMWQMWRERHYPATPLGEPVGGPGMTVAVPGDVFAYKSQLADDSKRPTAPPLPPHSKAKPNAAPRRPGRDGTPPPIPMNSVKHRRPARALVAMETGGREEPEESEPIAV